MADFNKSVSSKFFHTMVSDTASNALNIDSYGQWRFQGVYQCHHQFHCKLYWYDPSKVSTFSPTKGSSTWYSIHLAWNFNCRIRIAAEIEIIDILSTASPEKNAVQQCHRRDFYLFPFNWNSFHKLCLFVFEFKKNNDKKKCHHSNIQTETCLHKSRKRF